MALRAARKHPPRNSACGSAVVLERKQEVWAENTTCPKYIDILILLSQIQVLGGLEIQINPFLSLLEESLPLFHVNLKEQSIRNSFWDSLKLL